MTSALTAVLECPACDHKWTVADQPMPETTRFAFDALFGAAICPACQHRGAGFVRLRFSKLPDPPPHVAVAYIKGSYQLD